MGQGQGQGQLARLTALTPDSCWPMFMMMMETSCQRRERWDSRLSTDRWPSALSDCSSRRISDSSASTSSHPRRRCSAGGAMKHTEYHDIQFSVARFWCFLTFLCCLLVSSLDEHVPGALWEEGQQQELYQGRNASQTQHEGPTWIRREQRDTSIYQRTALKKPLKSAVKDV